MCGVEDQRLMERNDLFSPFLDLHKSKGHAYFPWLFWGAAPKGTKSCRAQGDFRSSVHLCMHLPPLPPPESQIRPLRPQISSLWPQVSLPRYQISSLSSHISSFRPQISPHPAQINPLCSGISLTGSQSESEGSYFIWDSQIRPDRPQFSPFRPQPSHSPNLPSTLLSASPDFTSALRTQAWYWPILPLAFPGLRLQISQARPHVSPCRFDICLLRPEPCFLGFETAFSSFKTAFTPSWA